MADACSDEISQPRIVTGAYGGSQFVRRPSDVLDDGECFFALGTGELLFHLCQCCPNDVVMMHVRPDRLGRIQPHAVDQLEIFGRE